MYNYKELHPILINELRSMLKNEYNVKLTAQEINALLKMMLDLGEMAQQLLTRIQLKQEEAAG